MLEAFEKVNLGCSLSGVHNRSSVTAVHRRVPGCFRSLADVGLAPFLGPGLLGREGRVLVIVNSRSGFSVWATRS